MSPKSGNPIRFEFFSWKLFRRDGVYYADGRGPDHLGKHSLGTRDRDEALKRLRQLDRQKAIERGLAPQSTSTDPASLSIAQGWSLFLANRGRNQVLGGVAPASVKRYQAVRDKHVAFCQRNGIDDWQHHDKSKLEHYGNWLGRTKAPRTVRLELELVKALVNWLIDEKKLPETARIRYRIEKPQGTDTYCYGANEVGAMIDHCRTTSGLGWLADVITTLAHTGVRIGELCQLRWSDVDLSVNLIRIADERASAKKNRAGTARTTKGKRSRAIPIHPRLRAVLQSINQGKGGVVFQAARGGKLRSRNVLDQFKKRVIEKLKGQFPTPTGEIGFDQGTIHGFRHFFCSQAFLGGANEGDVREWLGHANSQMVAHYRHLRAHDAQRKMKKIDFLGSDGQEDDPNQEAVA